MASVPSLHAASFIGATKAIPAGRSVWLWMHVPESCMQKPAHSRGTLSVP